MAESKVILLNDWVNDINSSLSEEDAKDVIYAIVQYSLYDKRIEVKDSLKATVLSYLTQVDKITKKHPIAGTGRKEKYDADAIRELASQGLDLRAICEKLGIPFSRGIYSNRGYKEGREIWTKSQEVKPPTPQYIF